MPVRRATLLKISSKCPIYYTIHDIRMRTEKNKPLGENTVSNVKICLQQYEIFILLIVVNVTFTLV